MFDIYEHFNLNLVFAVTCLVIKRSKFQNSNLDDREVRARYQIMMLSNFSHLHLNQK